MKGCLGNFVICFVGLCLFVFFFGGIPWVALAVAALLLAAAVTAFTEQASRLEELQARVERLEAGGGERRAREDGPEG